MNTTLEDLKTVPTLTTLENGHRVLLLGKTVVKSFGFPTITVNGIPCESFLTNHQINELLEIAWQNGWDCRDKKI